MTARLALAGTSAVLDATAERFAATMRAEAATRSPYPGRAELVVDELALEALPLQLDTPLTGRVRARVDAEGEGAALARATIAATIDKLDARWNDQPVTLDRGARGRYADRVMTVEQLHLRAQESTVSVSGRVPIDPKCLAGRHRFRCPPRPVVAGAAYAPRDVPLSADGALTIDGDVVGTARALDPD